VFEGRLVLILLEYFSCSFRYQVYSPLIQHIGTCKNFSARHTTYNFVLVKHHVHEINQYSTGLPKCRPRLHIAKIICFLPMYIDEKIVGASSRNKNIDEFFTLFSICVSSLIWPSCNLMKVAYMSIDVSVHFMR
jgi:hypothetical protein